MRSRFLTFAIFTLIWVNGSFGEVAVPKMPPALQHLGVGPRDAKLSQEEQTALADIAAQPSLESFLLLARICHEVPVAEAQERSLQLLLEMPNWQQFADSILLQGKRGWDEVNAGDR